MTETANTFERDIIAGHTEIAPLSPRKFVEAHDEDRSSLIQAATALFQDGYVAISNFLDRETAAELAKGVFHSLDKYLPSVRNAVTAEYDDYVVNCKLQRFKSFTEMAACSKPLFNLRHPWSDNEPDSGFVDLFKPSILMPQLQPIESEMTTGLPYKIINSFREVRYVHESCHLYINLGVVNTRGFHIDSDIPHIKAFLYLTDVLTMDSGPYCFVRGSHRENLIKSLNKRYNAATGRKINDMVLTNPSDAVAFLAPAGTLILSLQSGIHRGFPQGAESNRLALVQLFKPA